MKTSIIIIICSVLLNIYLIFHIFNKNTAEQLAKDKQEIETLEKQSQELSLQRDSIILEEKQFTLKIDSSKKSVKQIIKNRDEKDIVIYTLPDSGLLNLFSKFDSLSNHYK